MFDFLSMKPKQTPINTVKYPYRDSIKEVIQSLFKNGYYDPCNLEITEKTNVDIFDILEKDLEEEISWSRIGCLFNKARGSVCCISLFDARQYYVINSSWSIAEKDREAVKKFVKSSEFGPVFWRLDDDTSVLRFELPVSYPFSEDVLVNSLNLFDRMEAGIVDEILKVIS
ncbi:MAG: hypothetical protein KBD32_08085 [Burkholderiales bacterium]|jgi:hypothetical protein|nr:hypothetical protein [Burkholderiales bacterium]